MGSQVEDQRNLNSLKIIALTSFGERRTTLTKSLGLSLERVEVRSKLSFGEKEK